MFIELDGVKARLTSWSKSAAGKTDKRSYAPSLSVAYYLLHAYMKHNLPFTWNHLHVPYAGRH